MGDTTITPAPGTAPAGATTAAATGTGGTTAPATAGASTTPAAPPSSVTPAAAGTPPAAKAAEADASAAGTDSTLLGGSDGKANPDGKEGGAAEAQKATGPIEVKFPEGANVDAALVSEFTEMAGKFGLTQEAAQALVDLQTKANEAAGKQADETFAKMRTDWVAEIKADKEIGGPKFEANLAAARKAVAQFGGEAFRKFLDAFGVGDHPEMVRFVVKVGQAMSEDSVGGSTVTPAPSVTDEQTVLRARYPSMYKDG